MSVEILTPIDILSAGELTARIESGLLVPMHSNEGLKVVDCGDDRGLTEAYYGQRTRDFGYEVSPGRYYGAASGLAVASLAAITLQSGEQAIESFVGEFTPEGFVDFAANLSDRAHKRKDEIDLNQHSDDGKEDGNKVELADHKHCDNPLGCAFATYLGAITLGAGGEDQVDEALRIASIAGEDDLPIVQVAESLAVLGNHMKSVDTDFGIHRGALHHAQTRKPLHTPIAIHEGAHAPNDQTALIMDLAGFRSNANASIEAGLPRYVHTPSLAEELIPELVPELHNLDSRVLRAAGILLGSSTRRALSGTDSPGALRIEIIPAEYAQAA